MKPSEPQFIYLIVILPVLFGITMILDGLVSVVKKKDVTGWVNLISGIIFLGFILAAFLILAPNILK